METSAVQLGKRVIMRSVNTLALIACSACLVLFAQPVAAQSTDLKNPLKINSFGELIQAVINIVQIIAAPFLLFFVIYSGYLFTTARGNPEVLQRAKQSLLYAIIGAVIVIGAEAIAIIIAETARSFST